MYMQVILKVCYLKHTCWNFCCNWSAFEVEMLKRQSGHF